MQKTINLLESSTLTAEEKMKLFDEGIRRENLKACSPAKLIDYYTLCVDTGFHKARVQIEGELNRRGLDDHIIPSHYLSRPTIGMFTRELAENVIDAHGDAMTIIAYAEHSFSHGGVMIAAYILAIIANETVLEQQIRFFINTIGTYSKYMRSFMSRCMEDPKIVTHLNELRQHMEDYKARK